MWLITPKKQILFDICIIASLIAAVAVTFVSISHDIYDVFPYFYLIPVILLAYSRPKISIFVTVLIGWLYLALIYRFGIPDSRLFTLATVWFYIFVSLGVLISVYSTEYRMEGAKSFGTFASSQAGVFIFDKTTFRIQEVNRKFAEILRYDPVILNTMKITEILPGDYERKDFLDKLRDQPRAGDIEVKLLAADGSTRWALISAVETEEPIVMCTLVDITSHKLAEQALEQANRKLNLLNSITRHDILNQLTALLGYLELSKEGTSDPAMLRFIEREEVSAEAIKNQILFTRDYQNIGVHAPQWQNAAETLSLAMAQVNLSHVAFTVNLLPVEIYADPLLERVFYNIIDNSLRHGERVTTIMVRAEEGTGGLDLVIEDNGVGIPAGKKEQIFRREYFKNSGFGLFLSREILGITGLTIRETGHPGIGARFEIYAPKGAYRFIEL